MPRALGQSAGETLRAVTAYGLDLLSPHVLDFCNWCGGVGRRQLRSWPARSAKQRPTGWVGGSSTANPGTGHAGQRIVARRPAPKGGPRRPPRRSRDRHPHGWARQGLTTSNRPGPRSRARRARDLSRAEGLLRQEPPNTHAVIDHGLGTRACHDLLPVRTAWRSRRPFLRPFPAGSRRPPQV